MADEPPKEDANKGEGAPAKGPSPMVPILMIVVLVPAMTFGISQFLILPKIQKMIEASTQEGHGDPADGPKEAHEAPKKAKEEGGGHGGGHGEGAEEGSAQVCEFQDIVTNIAGGIQARYIRVSFTIEGDDPHFTQITENNRTKLIDTTLGILSALQWEEVQKPGTKNLVRNDLINAFNTALRGDIVKNLYFGQFVVQ